MWIAALHSALAIIAFDSHVHCDGSVTSSGILYIFLVVMLVLTSVRKIGAVTFLAAVTIGHAHSAIIALAIDAHRAGVGILIVSIIHSISGIDITLNLNAAVVLLSAFSSRVSDLFALATLTERARAELLSMPGCLAHRAVLWAASVIRSMRFRATVTAYDERL